MAALPRIIKILLGVNVGLFLLEFLTGGVLLRTYFSLDHTALSQFQIWRLVTYMFVHSVAPPFLHILFNMLMLWMFGVPLVYVLGEKKFAWFYFAAGVFSAFCTLIFFSFTGATNPVIGASGAIFGLMFAFAKFFPTQQFLMFFIFPVQARYAVLIIGGISLMLITSNDGIAHITHLGGALFAFLFFRYEDKIYDFYHGFKNRRGVRMEKEARKSETVIEQVMVDIDPILKKISETGISSLSKEEREKLQKASELKRKQKSKIINWDEYRNKQAL